jgi:hypothetical protein
VTATGVWPLAQQEQQQPSAAGTPQVVSHHLRQQQAQLKPLHAQVQLMSSQVAWAPPPPQAQPAARLSRP